MTTTSNKKTKKRKSDYGKAYFLNAANSDIKQLFFCYQFIYQSSNTVYSVKPELFMAWTSRLTLIRTQSPL